MKRYKFLSAALLGAVLTMGTVTSCSDSGYLDINYNPNYPSTASYKQLLPAAEGSIVAVSGLYQQITGDFWCQYVTQGNSTNQYNTLANYAVGALVGGTSAPGDKRGSSALHGCTVEGGSVSAPTGSVAVVR